MDKLAQSSSDNEEDPNEVFIIDQSYDGIDDKSDIDDVHSETSNSDEGELFLVIDEIICDESSSENSSSELEQENIKNTLQISDDTELSDFYTDEEYIADSSPESDNGMQQLPIMSKVDSLSVKKDESTSENAICELDQEKIKNTLQISDDTEISDFYTDEEYIADSSPERDDYMQQLPIISTASMPTMPKVDSHSEKNDESTSGNASCELDQEKIKNTLKISDLYTEEEDIADRSPKSDDGMQQLPIMFKVYSFSEKNNESTSENANCELEQEKIKNTLKISDLYTEEEDIADRSPKSDDGMQQLPIMSKVYSLSEKNYESTSENACCELEQDKLKNTLKISDLYTEEEDIADRSPESDDGMPQLPIMSKVYSFSEKNDESTSENAGCELEQEKIKNTLKISDLYTEEENIADRSPKSDDGMQQLPIMFKVYSFSEKNNESTSENASCELEQEKIKNTPKISKDTEMSDFYTEEEDIANRSPESDDGMQQLPIMSKVYSLSEKNNESTSENASCELEQEKIKNTLKISKDTELCDLYTEEEDITDRSPESDDGMPQLPIVSKVYSLSEKNYESTSENACCELEQDKLKNTLKISDLYTEEEDIADRSPESDDGMPQLPIMSKVYSVSEKNYESTSENAGCELEQEKIKNTLKISDLYMEEEDIADRSPESDDDMPQLSIMSKVYSLSEKNYESTSENASCELEQEKIKNTLKISDLYTEEEDIADRSPESDDGMPQLPIMSKVYSLSEKNYESTSENAGCELEQEKIKNTLKISIDTELCDLYTEEEDIADRSPESDDGMQQLPIISKVESLSDKNSEVKSETGSEDQEIYSVLERIYKPGTAVVEKKICSPENDSECHPMNIEGPTENFLDSIEVTHQGRNKEVELSFIDKMNRFDLSKNEVSTTNLLIDFEAIQNNVMSHEQNQLKPLFVENKSMYNVLEKLKYAERSKKVDTEKNLEANEGSDLKNDNDISKEAKREVSKEINSKKRKLPEGNNSGPVKQKKNISNRSANLDTAQNNKDDIENKEIKSSVRNEKSLQNVMVMKGCSTECKEIKINVKDVVTSKPDGKYLVKMKNASSKKLDLFSGEPFKYPLSSKPAVFAKECGPKTPPTRPFAAATGTRPKITSTRPTVTGTCPKITPTRPAAAASRPLPKITPTRPTAAATGALPKITPARPSAAVTDFKNDNDISKEAKSEVSKEINSKKRKLPEGNNSGPVKQKKNISNRSADLDTAQNNKDDIENKEIKSSVRNEKSLQNVMVMKGYSTECKEIKINVKDVVTSKPDGKYLVKMKNASSKKLDLFSGEPFKYPLSSKPAVFAKECGPKTPPTRPFAAATGTRPKITSTIPTATGTCPKITPTRPAAAASRPLPKITPTRPAAAVSRPLPKITPTRPTVAATGALPKITPTRPSAAVTGTRPKITPTGPTATGARPKITPIKLAAIEARPKITPIRPAAAASRPLPKITPTRPAAAATGALPKITPIRPSATVTGTRPKITPRPTATGARPKITPTRPAAAATGALPKITPTRPSAALTGTRPTITPTRPTVTGACPKITPTRPAAAVSRHLPKITPRPTAAATGARPKITPIKLAATEARPMITPIRPAGAASRPLPKITLKRPSATRARPRSTSTRPAAPANGAVRKTLKGPASDATKLLQSNPRYVPRAAQSLKLNNSFPQSYQILSDPTIPMQQVPTADLQYTPPTILDLFTGQPFKCRLPATPVVFSEKCGPKTPPTRPASAATRTVRKHTPKRRAVAATRAVRKHTPKRRAVAATRAVRKHTPKRRAVAATRAVPKYKSSGFPSNPFVPPIASATGQPHLSSANLSPSCSDATKSSSIPDPNSVLLSPENPSSSQAMVLADNSKPNKKSSIKKMRAYPGVIPIANLPVNLNVLDPVITTMPYLTQASPQEQIRSTFAELVRPSASTLPGGYTIQIVPSNSVHFARMMRPGPSFVSEKRLPLRMIYALPPPLGQPMRTQAVEIQSLAAISSATSSVRTKTSQHHPPPLPLSPTYFDIPEFNKTIPPMPSLKVSSSEHVIYLTWNLNLLSTHAAIASYELYSYKQLNVPLTLWEKLDDIKALPLPMACTLVGSLDTINCFYFAIRVVDEYSRIGPFSNIVSISY